MNLYQMNSALDNAIRLQTKRVTAGIKNRGAYSKTAKVASSAAWNVAAKAAQKANAKILTATGTMGNYTAENFMSATKGTAKDATGQQREFHRLTRSASAWSMFTADELNEFASELSGSVASATVAGEQMAAYNKMSDAEKKLFGAVDKIQEKVTLPNGDEVLDPNGKALYTDLGVMTRGKKQREMIQQAYENERLRANDAAFDSFKNSVYYDPTMNSALFLDLMGDDFLERYHGEGRVEWLEENKKTVERERDRVTAEKEELEQEYKKTGDKDLEAEIKEKESLIAQYSNDIDSINGMIKDAPNNPSRWRK